MNYYNEIDPFAAAWLRELIKAGHISQGEVDERSIEDVVPSDLRGYKQCHFFAGIGGWSYALRLAGWPDDREVWTGSCPCQPFSAAGKRKGTADERHLWPAFFHLVAQLHPPMLFGEQVASKDGLQWLDAVLFDMEGAGYALGAADMCAASVGAPHIRQRLFFVANSTREQLNGPRQTRAAGRRELANGGRLEHAPSKQVGLPRCAWEPRETVQCSDGKLRPVEPGTFPLAHGVPNRVGRLRGYGNAIVPQVAQAFISAAMECLG